jgi:hypothetical protein
MAEQILPFAADQATTVVSSGSGQQKKKRVVLASKHKKRASSDQVITELPPYRGPQSPLYLVVVEFVYARGALGHTDYCGTRRSDSPIRTSMVGPSLPGFTIAPCVDSLMCYRIVQAA